MASLVEIQRSKWLHLRDLYRAAWPECVAAYCVLDTQVANPALSDNINFKVYSPEGDITYGMVATIDLFGYYQVLIYPLKNLSKTEEALQNSDSNIVDWSRGAHVSAATLEVIEILKNLQQRLGINIEYNTVSYKHLLDDDIPEYNISCPPESYVADLKPEHIPLLVQTWPYQKATSYKFFELIMNQNMTYVLYSTKNHEPMAWIAINVEGHLTHLYTLEPYRRLGYGEFLTKYAANDLKRNGRCVVAYTVDSNATSQRMFDKLGFRVAGIEQWITVQY